jgi:hypothetical protein
LNKYCLLTVINCKFIVNSTLSLKEPQPEREGAREARKEERRHKHGRQAFSSGIGP